MKNVYTKIRQFLNRLKRRLCPTMRLLHRVEHLGNIIILASVTFGVHEMESIISGGLALILIWQFFAADGEA